jgi:hypothetical protein
MLGVPAEDRHYFDLHSVLDVKHSLAWNTEAAYPLAEMDPNFAPALAEGALMHLECGAACFRRYRQELGLACSLVRMGIVAAIRQSTASAGHRRTAHHSPSCLMPFKAKSSCRHLIDAIGVGR